MDSDEDVDWIEIRAPAGSLGLRFGDGPRVAQIKDASPLLLEDIREGDAPSRFTVAYNGVSVDVVHTGSEPALFKAGLPVVVEGNWTGDGSHFASTRLLVKHTENYKKNDDGKYEEEHPDRVDEDDPDQGAT